MKMEEIREIYSKNYDKGLLNHGVRAWFYLNRGLDLVNQFKYLLAGIFALYYTLKLDDYRWLVVIFIVSIPILTVSGFFWTHYMAKRLEYNSIFFASFWGRYNVDLSEKTAEHTVKNSELLSEIRELLKELLTNKK